MSNWADLPTDLLRSVLSRLPVADFVRSRAVCTSWRYAAAEFRRTPYLLFCSGEPSTASFFSPSEDRTYTIHCPLPDIHQRIFIGSSHGWLLTFYESAVIHLLNPLTGAQIELPSVGNRTFYYLQSAALSASPADLANCTVVLLHRHPRMLSFTRVADGKWSSIETDIYYQDITFHNSRLFLLENNGSVYSWDLTIPFKPTVVAVAGPQIIPYGLSCIYVKYLMPTPSGDLLQVWQAVDINMRNGIKVHKIDLKNGQISCMNDLGDRALFLSARSSVNFPVADIYRLKRNHVYFSYAKARDNLNPTLAICDYNLDYGSMELLFTRTPSLNSSPVWIMPSLS